MLYSQETDFLNLKTVFVFLYLPYWLMFVSLILGTEAISENVGNRIVILRLYWLLVL